MSLSIDEDRNLSSITTLQMASNHPILVKAQGKIMSLIITILIITSLLSIVLVVVSF